MSSPPTALTLAGGKAVVAQRVHEARDVARLYVLLVRGVHLRSGQACASVPRACRLTTLMSCPGWPDCPTGTASPKQLLQQSRRSGMCGKLLGPCYASVNCVQCGSG